MRRGVILVPRAPQGTRLCRLRLKSSNFLIFAFHFKGLLLLLVTCIKLYLSRTETTQYTDEFPFPVLDQAVGVAEPHACTTRALLNGVCSTSRPINLEKDYWCDTGMQL